MRALGLAIDPNSANGGSTHDDLLLDNDPIEFPDPTIWVPTTDANVTPGENRSDRNNLNQGRRGNVVPRPWSAAPSLTASSLAFPDLVKAVTSRAAGVLSAATGTAPAPLTTKATPKQSGVLPSMTGRLIREGQTDDVSGLWFNTWTLALPQEGEGTFEFAAMGLYHEVSETSGSDPVTDYSDYLDTFEIRSAKIYDGPTGTDLIDCVSSATITFGNGLLEEARARYCNGRNLVQKLDGGKRYRLWYPTYNKLGPQTMGLTLDFGEVHPGRELDRLFAVASKLVVEATAGPATTTPASDDLIRFTFGQGVITGGGPDGLKKDGEQYSSYEYQGGIDPATGSDLEIAYAGAAAVTFA